MKTIIILLLLTTTASAFQSAPPGCGHVPKQPHRLIEAESAHSECRQRGMPFAFGIYLACSVWSHWTVGNKVQSGYVIVVPINPSQRLLEHEYAHLNCPGSVD